MANECIDAHCPVHGGLKTRGSRVEGLVVSDKGRRTIVVERNMVKFVPKYERYARSRSRISAHNPDCIGAKTGDTVGIAECRKISRTKAWVVTEIVKKAEKAT